MLATSPAFAGFSVDDIDAARRFYGGTLGIAVSPLTSPGMAEMLVLRPAGGTTVLLYPKADHVPATFTVLNFAVEDIDRAVDALAAAGVPIETCPRLGEPDRRGIHRSAGIGPHIAWFRDPAGNVLSVLEEAAGPPRCG